MPSSLPIGDAVRRLRLALGLSQSELAERSGIATGVMSMVENNRVSATSEMIEVLAEVLDCSPTYLREERDDVFVGRPWLRAYADAPSRVVERAIADSSTAIDAAQRLSLRLVPDSLPAFDGDPNDDEEVERFATEVRAVANIAEGDVVRNMVRTAERLGCVVLPMVSELGRHLGLSTRVDGSPVIRVSRSGSDSSIAIPGDRQRFTVAHEVGHLTLHHARQPPDSAADAARVEKQAHRFAAAFLAPADPLVADLDRFGGRVTLGTLAQLKEIWGVAIKMLVVRFQNLGIIDEDQARSLYKQISSRRWNKSEPVAVPVETSVWLSKAVALRFPDSDNPVAAASSAIGLGNEYFARWMSWDMESRTRGMASVVTLPRAARAEDSTSRTHAASVVRLPVRAGKS